MTQSTRVRKGTKTAGRSPNDSSFLWDILRQDDEDYETLEDQVSLMVTEVEETLELSEENPAEDVVFIVRAKSGLTITYTRGSREGDPLRLLGLLQIAQSCVTEATEGDGDAYRDE
jgi:hypothetical protein